MSIIHSVMHRRPGTEFINVADTEGQLSTKRIIHAEFESALLTPVATPRVANNPIFLTMTMLLLVLCLSKANDSNSVIDNEGLFRAVKIVFSNDTVVVAHQDAWSEDSSSHRLLN